MMQSSIRFDRATGRLEGASQIERAAAAVLTVGAKASRLIVPRGFSLGCRVVASVLDPREIVVRLNDDALFAFPFSDGYWSKLLDRNYVYESEIEQFLLGVMDVDYKLVDGGANFGYWSVLASSRPYGSHPVVAIEASSANAAQLARNAELNGDRFTILQRAISSEPGGAAWLSGAKHEAFQIGSDVATPGESVELVALDSLLDQQLVSAGQRLVIKLDVEGMEIEAIKGSKKLLDSEVVIIAEDHGMDNAHTVSRYLARETPCKVFVLDPLIQRYEQVIELSMLDRIKTNASVGYNVFATNSQYWEERIRSIRPSTATTVGIIDTAPPRTDALS